MLRSILEDRFNIRVHRERQQRPIYKLVTARRDRSLAAGLRRAPLDCGTRADRRPPGRPGDLTAPPAPGDGPSIFAAVQEQLGLRLEAGRALLDVLVVDTIERPSPN
jgi:hypothetical protein